MSLPNNAQRKKIFISYRVQDTSADTGRLVDSLKQAFYEDQIFMDIEKLDPGVDFTQALANSLESCDVLFAIIGPEWAGPADDDGVTRINQPNDWVRVELETALKRNIRVIPVLMRNASLPDQHEIPESLHPLLNRQAYEISNKRWKYDTDQLIAFLKQLGFQSKTTVQEVPLPKPARSSTGGIGKWLVYGLAGLGVLVLIGLVMQVAEGDSTGNTGPVYSDTAGKSPVQPIRQSNNQDPDGEKERSSLQQNEPAALNMNVSGTWFDATNQYYMYINQNGNTLELKSVTAAGVATGEGVGTISGNKLTFKVQLYNIGVISGNATVPEDALYLNGKFAVEGNGASYTESFYWTKQISPAAE